MTLRLATYNVNSVRARLSVLESWLRRVRPDVVCLQETKVQDAAFPVDAFRELGYRSAFRGEKSYNGVAILSLEEPSDVRFGLEDDGPADEARLIAASLGKLHVVNTYVPQGRDADDPMFRYKLEWLARLRRYFARRYTPRSLVVWAGDFNIAPEAIDVHDPKRLLGHVCFHPDAHRALADVRAWGFVDAFRRHVSEPGQYTFYDYRVRDAVARGLGWRVDHIWATQALAQRSTAAWIDLAPRTGETPSDHTPLVVEFDVPN
ncbi:MAG: exodeoxyribonuclease III [Candidatus Bipolaricaulis sp.]|nr:exodeoxyribonuclease III [Candidatus Bipolaricaulis sp.]